MKNSKSKLSFKNYIVNKIEFENNIECESEETELDFDLDSHVDFVNEDEFILTLTIEIFKNAKQNNYPFNFKSEILGSFLISDVEEEKKQIYAEQNAVAILFPYCRALVTTYTGLANVNPLILPPINVVKYLKNKEENLANES